MKKITCNGFRTIFSLQLAVCIYSLSGIAAKMASCFDSLSVGFIICYVGEILALGVYAVLWQQIIKRLPLTTAFANKAVTVVWGIVWGVVFFHEKITPGKLLGAAIVIVGVVLCVLSDKQEESHDP